MQTGPLGREDPLEVGMATHSSTLDQRIPWTEEPGRLQSIVSQSVIHDWSNLATTYRTARKARALELGEQILGDGSQNCVSCRKNPRSRFLIIILN